ncbi:MAG: diguanylate cyclase [Bacteroidetes bacterium]|nr:diguanylate cyclase [Bacteroidota bacterium]
MKILIVEDDIGMQDLLAAMVRSLGHEVMTADNGAEAWDLHQTQKFPLVICDWVMPIMSGTEFTRKVRTSQQLHYTYIILISSMTGKNNYLQVMDAGADDFVPKPVDKDELAARIRVAERIIRLQVQLEEMSQLDGLTGLSNRRRFDLILNEDWRRQRRAGGPISLIMIDIDFFKNYNDHYGHLAGDEVLKTVSTVLDREGNRAGDLVARYGGEEFAVILAGTTESASILIAERIRKEVTNLRIPHEYSQVADHITISLGVATVHPEPDQSNPNSLVSLADTALYQAKRHGRNQVAVYREGMEVNGTESPQQ